MLGILTRVFWNGTISFETFIETENSCCVPRFPLIASCYKIVDSQTSSLCVKGSEIWKGRSWTCYLRLRNLAVNNCDQLVDIDALIKDQLRVQKCH